MELLVRNWRDCYTPIRTHFEMRSVGFSVRQCLADGFYIPWQIAAREVGVASRPGQRIRVRRSLEGVPGGEALARVAKPRCCLLHRLAASPASHVDPKLWIAYVFFREWGYGTSFPFLNIVIARQERNDPSRRDFSAFLTTTESRTYKFCFCASGSLSKVKFELDLYESNRNSSQHFSFDAPMQTICVI